MQRLIFSTLADEQLNVIIENLTKGIEAIKLDREKKIELLKWLKQGYAESKTIEAWCSDGENTLRPPSEMTEDEIIAEIEKIRAARDV